MACDFFTVETIWLKTLHAADMFGVSGRQLLEALVAGQRDPKVLAQLAQGRMRSKLSDLAEALTGHFRAHHGYLLQMMPGRIDALGAQIEQPGRPDRPSCSPRCHQVAQLDAVPGVGRIGAQQLIGRDRHRDGPLPQRRTPGVVGQPRAHDQGRSRQDPSPAPTGNANPWIGATVEQAAMGASRTTTFPWAPATGGSCKRQGTKRAWSPSATRASPSPTTCSWTPGPLRRPRRRLPRPPAPPTPNPAADPRTRTPLRQAGHPPRHRLITGRHRHNRTPPA